jgi:GT2 family glycosyltransferase
LIKISIIIVNYNVQYFLEQCLLCLREATQNVTAEIIVIDNNSSDGSCSMVQANFPEVLLLANKENIGFSKANSQGVAIAKGEYILILNPDTIVPENILTTILNFADKLNNLGALGVKMIDGDGQFLPESKRHVPNEKVAIQKILGISQNYYANDIDQNENSKVEILTGAFMLMKCDTFKKVGGFDEDYFMYGEDIDLSYKLLQEGFQNYYMGKSTIIHYKGESTLKNITYLKSFYGAMQIFYKKHFTVNYFYNSFLKFGVKILIFINWINGYSKRVKTIKKERIFLIGNDDAVFLKVKNNNPRAEVKMIETIPIGLSSSDLLIFDGNYIENNNIIAMFCDDKLKRISKRVIPKNANYYIGSDASTSHGEIVIL